MRTIAFVTQKGGAGKSTLALNLSVTARLAGERVVLLDLDPLQSLVKWAKLRKGEELPVEFVPAQKLQKTLETLEKKGVSLVVLDAPGHDGVAQDAAIAAADLVVIPARPNVFDLWASEVTRVKVKEQNKDYSFLLNQCPPAQQSQRVEQGAKALQAMGGLLSPLVSARVDFQEAARQGLGVSELRPSGEAAAEMHELWAGVKRRMKKAAKADAKIEKKTESRPAAAAQVKPQDKPAAKAPEVPAKAADKAPEAPVKPAAKAPEAPAKAAAKPTKAADKPATKPIEKPELKAERPAKAAVKLTVVKAA